MKTNFGKYWDECNMPMAVAAILDSRQNMRVVEFAYPQFYAPSEDSQNISNIHQMIFELYDEYIAWAVTGGLVASSSS